MKAPTLRGRDASEDDQVWLVPCFLISAERRRMGVATALLRAAVGVAEQAGATAIEGFPLSGSRSRSKSADFMTGTESLFSSCGFGAVRRPFDNRVIMRHDFVL